jgi:hypothetical protein
VFLVSVKALAYLYSVCLVSITISTEFLFTCSDSEGTSDSGKSPLVFALVR